MSKYYIVLWDESIENAIQNHTEGYDTLEEILTELPLYNKDTKFEFRVFKAECVGNYYITNNKVVNIGETNE